jgi:hypothetical protein
LITANPLYGGLSIAVRAAESSASYTGTSAVANSTSVDLGYLGNSLAGGGSNACTGAGATTPSVPLSGVQASSASGPLKATGDGGMETATSSAKPETAASMTTLVPVTVPGLLAVNGKSSSSVAYASGKYQDATATTTLDLSLAGGLVDVQGLQWTATDNTGKSKNASADFEIGSVKIAGVTTKIVSAAQLSALVPTINKVLAVQGLTLVLPKMSTSSVTGAVTMGPLRLAIRGTSLTNKILTSLSAPQSSLEKQIAAVINGTGNACISSIAADVGVGELVAGIVEGILAGGGVIDLDLGGANAVTEAAPNYKNPFAGESGAKGGQTSGGHAGTPNTLKTTTGSGTPAIPAAPGVGSAPTSGAAQPAEVATGLSTPSGVLHCVTTSPAARPSCWGGAAPLAAGGLLVLGGGLFAIDAVRSRRRITRPRETL